MNKIVSFLFICLLLADLHAQNTIKIIDKDKDKKREWERIGARRL